jgi:hypothetical protein
MFRALARTIKKGKTIGKRTWCFFFSFLEQLLLSTNTTERLWVPSSAEQRVKQIFSFTSADYTHYPGSDEIVPSPHFLLFSFFSSSTAYPYSKDRIFFCPVPSYTVLKISVRSLPSCQSSFCAIAQLFCNTDPLLLPARIYRPRYLVNIQTASSTAAHSLYLSLV